MCRLTAILSSEVPVLIESIVTKPKLSIIYQSFNCHERWPRDRPRWAFEKSSLNGDGFGVGWYVPKNQFDLFGDPHSPCVFTSLKPAWSDQNLRQLAKKTLSPLIFAHVRAAGPGSGYPTEANCHPFRFGKYMFMHNGQIGAWRETRRALLARLKSDAAFDFALDNNPIDSVILFALFIDNLNDGETLNDMRRAMERMIEIVCEVCDELKVEEGTYVNSVVSDGSSIAATRFALGAFSSRESVPSLSLYFATGTRWACDDKDDFKMTHSDKRDDTCIITSEPLTEVKEEWVPVPHNTLVLVTSRCDVLMQPLSYPPKKSSQTETQPHRHRSSISQSLESLKLRLPMTADSPVRRREAVLTCRRILSRPGAAVLCLATLERKFLFAGDSLGRLIVWDLELEQCMNALTGHNGSVLALTVFTSPDKTNWIFSSSSDATVAIWRCQKRINNKINEEREENKIRGEREKNKSTQQREEREEKKQMDVREDTKVTDQDKVIEKDKITLVCRLYFEPLQGDILSLAINKIRSGDIQSNQENINNRNGDTKSYDRNKRFSRGDMRNSNGDTRSCGDEIVSDGDMRSVGDSEIVRGREFMVLGFQSSAIGLISLDSLMQRLTTCHHFVTGGSKCTAENCRLNEFVSVDNFGCKQIHLGASVEAQASQPCKRADFARGIAPIDLLNGQKLRLSLAPCIKTGDTKMIGTRDTKMSGTGETETIGIVETVETRSNGETETVASMSGSGSGESWSGLDWTLLKGGGEENEHCGFIESLCVTDEYMATGGGDGLILIWKELKRCASLTGHTGGVLCLCAAQEDTLYSGSRDGTIRVWDIRTFSCRQILRGHQGDVMSIALAGKFVVSASACGEVIAWSRRWSEICLTLELEGIRKGVARDGDLTVVIAFLCRNENGDLMGAGGDGIIRIWNTGEISNGDSVSPSPLARSLLDQEAGLALSAERILATLVPLRSISGRSHFVEELWATATQISSLLESIGADTSLHPTGPSAGPIVMGCIGNDVNAQTILLYSHYDVVASGDPNEFETTRGSVWEFDPWQLTSVNGFFRGRGVSDNKGPLVAQVLAVRDFLAHQRARSTLLGAPPGLNIIFVSEGEEENGSVGFKEFLAAQKQTLKEASGALFTNSYWVENDVPCIVHGMRGVIDMQIIISSGREPLGFHSGIHGGAIVEPLTDLIAIVSQLLDGNGRSCVPGFYDDVDDFEFDEALKSTSAFCMEKYKDDLRSNAFHSDAPKLLLHKRWFEPVMSITEINTSTQNFCDLRARNFRIIPSIAVCHISIRSVPSQDSASVIDCVKKFVAERFAERRSPNTLQVRTLKCHNWWQGGTNSKIYRAVRKAVKDTWGVEPMCVREGGTMPIISELQESLGVPTVHLPLGQASDKAHLPNEQIRIENVVKGAEVIKRTLLALAGSSSDP